MTGSILSDEFQDGAEFVTAYENPNLPDSTWYFAREPSLADNMELRRLEGQLKQYEDDEERALASIRGYLNRMTRRFEGPAYTFSSEFKTKDGKRHPQAGKVMKPTLENIGKIPARYCLAAYVFIVGEYSALRRSDSDEESFPGGPADLDGSQTEAGTVPSGDES